MKKMKSITRLDDLNLPKKQNRFILGFLKQAKQINSFPQIDMFILFGSCARGNANLNSDVDIIAIGNGIGDETLFDLYDCAGLPELENEYGAVNNDILVNDRKYFDYRTSVVGSLQWRINNEGVILNELLNFD